MDVVEVLRLGREHVASHWTQGVLWSHDGAVCALGAVRAAKMGFPADKPVEHLGIIDTAAEETALASALPRSARGPEASYSITAYNDKPGRRQSAILRLFDRAIAAQS